MKIRMTICCIVLSVLNLNAQCISSDKIKYGGDWSSYDYTYFCPSYTFAYNGENSRDWNILNSPIDINLVGRQIFPLKKKIESIIKGFAGNDFFRYVHFNSVEIVYPDSLGKFEDRLPSCDMKKCNAKYFFSYVYSPMKEANYHIGIAVSKDWKILNKFNFPSKKDFQPVDTSLSICSIVKIAESYKSKVLPIESIRFDFDPKDNKFYWVVEQETFKDGEQVLQDLYIDATNRRKTKFVKRYIWRESYYGVETEDI